MRRHLAQDPMMTTNEAADTRALLGHATFGPYPRLSRPYFADRLRSAFINARTACSVTDNGDITVSPMLTM